jgi:spore germination cell wall hydrolase CwlJ-like protein
MYQLKAEISAGGKGMLKQSLIALNIVLGLIFVSFLTTAVANHKFSEYRNRDFTTEYMTAAEVEKNLQCLAMNIYKEAGYEPFEGKVAVAQVTMNRVESDQFPNDICSVVHQKNRFTEKVVCQFSWYCDSKHRNRPVGEEAYNESYEVAKKVLLENFRLQSVEGALYYHADYINPNWKKKRVAKIGQHIFYT